MDSLIQDFLQESNENLNRLDHEFVSLEKDPKNKELLGSIFRTIHTIKGTCGFLGFLKLESLAHESFDELIQQNAEELEAAIRATVWTLGISTTLALVIGITISLFLSRKISTATASVLRQAEAIASGELTG